MKKAEIAKAAVETGATTLEKSFWLAALNERAVKKRLPGETVQQAFARVITEDDKGKALYAALKIAPGKEFEEAPRVAKAAPVAEVAQAHRKIEKLADELMKNEPHLTQAQAWTRIFETNVELRKAVAAEEQAAMLRRAGQV